MKIIVKVLRVSIGVVFFAMIALFIYYFYDKDYLEGEERHYIGTSNVTEGQVVELLGANVTVGSMYGQVSQFEILEDGIIEITYDYYSEGIYPFLVVAKYSYFDTPLVNNIKEEMGVLLALVGCFAFMALAFWWINKRPSTNEPSKFSRGAFAAMWYLMHPKYIIGAPKAIGQYPPQMLSPLNIDLNDQGILCARTWKYKDGYLYSTGIGQSCWKTSTLLANRNPEENNENGIYATRLGAMGSNEFLTDIIGIVSLKGEWCEHADGVLRAERCDILHLIVGKYHQSVSSLLSSVYGVPVTVSDNPTNKYLDWLMKENGVACMAHNLKIMEASHGN